jgi:hypothetical protein
MVKTGEIKYSDINNHFINGSGIYAWCIELPIENLNKANRVKHLKKLLALYSKKIELKGNAYFETYIGNIEKLMAIDFDRIDLFNDNTYEFLRESVKKLCPPLYIGKTENDLTLRLQKHVYLLNNYMDVNFVFDSSTDNTSQFMKRIREKKIDKSWLYVQYVVFENETGINASVELQIEYLMNRLINPVLGRN